MRAFRRSAQAHQAHGPLLHQRCWCQPFKGRQAIKQQSAERPALGLAAAIIVHSDHTDLVSHGRHWCLGDLKIGGASGCSVFAKRQTTEEERTTIGESNIVEMSY